MTSTLASISWEELLCHALGHRWTPTAGQYVIVAGARCLDWELTCENGCNSTATELRDAVGARLPGTYRRYNLAASYQAGNGYYRHEYIAEMIRRKQWNRRS